MNTQKILPVATSIALILIIALLRDRSRTLAAVFGTMPLNMPLALWVVFGASDEGPVAAANFARSLLVGLVPTFIWLVVVYFALRAGNSLGIALLIAYAVWAVLMGIAYFTGILTVPK